MLTEHIEAEYQESYIHTYRLTQIMTIMIKSYIDKALRAEHQIKHKQRKSSSIVEPMPSALTLQAFWLGNVLVRMFVTKELFFEHLFFHTWLIK